MLKEKTSDEILPIKERLTPQQVLELEGLSTLDNFTFFTQSVPELLLKYDQALKKAESQLIGLEGRSVENLNDRIEELEEQLEESEQAYSSLVEDLQPLRSYIPPHLLKKISL